MLEIRDICKTYTPKRGAPVTALDHVNLQFGDHGLVFILGKSGSGKSTLLNVIGGLDRADSGEFIIKGKSSTEFSQSDFDAYRNTFIGFIFQEYNILNEFSVGANIALAMELQGKKATPEALGTILEQVGLTGFANRRPNELSGGQKQRVAIARALIKDPQVIMADEPTGALDSKTGIQIFDTLKELSKTKLVLVVSHDRDFAEQYGDRVIELSDGKVISDITQYTPTPRSATSGIDIVDDHILKIHPGYVLTAEDVRMINEYLARAKQDAIVSIDAEANQKFNQMAMITDNGSRKSFRKTATEDLDRKVYDKTKTRFIRARLPLRNAAKIARSSMKVKPFRLFVTILLSFVAFSMFGLSDTVGSYDRVTTMTDSILDSSIDNATFSLMTKRYYGEGENDFFWSNGEHRFTYSELAALSQLVGAEVSGVYTPRNSQLRLEQNLLDIRDLSSSSGTSGCIYNTTPAGIICMTESDLQRLGFTLTGSLPQSAQEIAITKHLFDLFQFCGFISADETPQEIPAGTLTPDRDPKTGILGKCISFADKYQNNAPVYVISGIIDTHFDVSRYPEFVPTHDQQTITKTDDAQNEILLYLKARELEGVLQYGYHQLLFLSKDSIDTLIRENEVFALPVGKSLEEYYADFRYTMSNQSNRGIGRGISAVASLKEFLEAGGKVLWTDGIKNTLNENEILIPISCVQDLLWNDDSLANQRPPQSSYTIAASPYDTTEQSFDYLTEMIANCQQIACYAYAASDEGRAFATSDVFRAYAAEAYPVFDEETGEVRAHKESELICAFAYDLNIYSKQSTTGAAKICQHTAYELEQKFIFDVLKTQISLSFTDCKVSASSGATFYNQEVTVVGFTIPLFFENTDGGYSTEYFLSDSLRTYFNTAETGIYSFAIMPMPKSAAAVRQLVELHYNRTGNTVYHMENAVTQSLDTVDEIVDVLSQIFFWIGVGFAIFAAIMLSNFIAVSIAYKKREIGILRAVGARSGDVFRIFFTESLFITLINYALSLVGTFVGTYFINNILRIEAGLLLTILHFGIRQVLLMLVISVGVAAVASFLPVYLIAKKRPIDAIQDR